MRKVHTITTRSSEGITTETFSVDDAGVESLEDVLALLDETFDEVEEGDSIFDILSNLKNSVSGLFFFRLEIARNN